MGVQEYTLAAKPRTHIIQDIAHLSIRSACIEG